MPLYNFKAYNEQGKIIGGLIDAHSVSLAYEKIKNKKYYPVKVQEESGEKGGSLFFKKEELISSLRQLSSLLRSGMPLPQALEGISYQIENEKFKRIFKSLKVSLEEGETFASALAEEKLFPTLLVKMVEVGEEIGVLENILEKYAEFLEKEIEFQKKILTALFYPLVVISASLGLIFFILTYISPILFEVFKNFKKKIPFSTQILLYLGEFLKGNWIIILIIIILSVSFYKKFIPLKNREKIILRLSFHGWLKKHIILSRWSRNLAMLHSGGIPLFSALEFSRKVIGSPLMNDLFKDLSKRVEKGENLSSAMKKQTFFPPLLIQMIETGEKSAELDKMLNSAALFYEKEIDRRLNLFLQFLEPAMILFLGIVVGFVVISMLLPIFEINRLIK